MDYKKFFNSNPSAAGNSAVTNIKALQEMQLWLGGQEIIDIKVGEAGDGYTPLTFTKENGDTYTVNIPTVKGATGDTGLEALSIISVYESATIPTVNGGATLNIDDFNRTPNSGERAIMFVITNDGTDVAKIYITEVSINYVSDTTVSCIYRSVDEISTKPTINEFNYVGEWVSGDEYHKNDCVYYRRSSYGVNTYYICTENISNSTTSPNNDNMHWAVISTNATNYYELKYGYKITIETNASFQLNETSYIHLVTIKASSDTIIVDTFCITNSDSNPSVDDFINFLKVVTDTSNNYIMASGREISGNRVLTIINGVSYSSRVAVTFRGYRITD